MYTGEINQVTSIASFIGLKFNTKKTKIMRLNGKFQDHIVINGTPLEEVATQRTLMTLTNLTTLRTLTTPTTITTLTILTID